MALDLNTTAPDRTFVVPPVTDAERHAHDLDRHDTGRSNFGAFLLGGIAIAGSLLGFLYYDTDNLSRGDSLTTGSITQVVPREGAQSPPALRIPVQPNATDR